MAMEGLMHYGVSKLDGAQIGSGRYPLGSGENPNQHLDEHPGYNLNVDRELKSKGWTESQRAEYFGLKTPQYRAERSIAKDADRAEKAARALHLSDKGYGSSKIAELMGLPESTVRSLLEPTYSERASKTKNAADVLKRSVDDKGFIDVSAGIELDVGVSRDRFKTAIAMLEKEGYEKFYVKIPQLGTTNYTTMEVLCPPGTKYKDLVNNLDQVKTITEYTKDNGKTFESLKPPVSLSSDRLQIRYNEQGGIDQDGVIEIRRGCADLSLGMSNYAQVRIAVDDKLYLKGMARYSDDMPPGVDVIFNTNKHEGTPLDKVLKPMKDDPLNPFGATIKPDGQHMYLDENGVQRQSVINIVNEEGDWSKWSRNLPTQFLAKQSVPLINKQLNLTYAEKEAEYDSIMRLTNPTVKKALLESFADDCDASAVHLKAASLPRQATHVLLPVPDMNPDKIYAPNYRDGEEVHLIRFPFAGNFEMATLKVDNSNKSAKDILGTNPVDAVGISADVPIKRGRLSGADFDGDTVLIIPATSAKLHRASPLKKLEGFDPKEAYPGYDGMKVLSKSNTQIEMGKISNLITDMTLRGASEAELARAVKHSMVVIDAHKHKLNYKLSEKQNGIDELKRKYQMNEEGGTGASTLFSRAKSPVYVTPRASYKIDPQTGEKIYQEQTKNLTYTNKDGKVVERKQESTRMAETKDAYELSSGHIKENIYADYANKMKALGNACRREAVNTPRLEYSPEANKKYAAEVESINNKLLVAQRNAPLERQAQILANKIFKQKKEANPDMDKDDQKKAKGQALSYARATTGAKKNRIAFTDKEWEAVQSGAISDSKLKRILNNADMDTVRSLATPRNTNKVSDSQIRLIKALKESSKEYTNAAIADRLGVSTTTVSKVLNGKI